MATLVLHRHAAGVRACQDRCEAPHMSHVRELFREGHILLVLTYGAFRAAFTLFKYPTRDTQCGGRGVKYQGTEHTGTPHAVCTGHCAKLRGGVRHTPNAAAMCCRLRSEVALLRLCVLLAGTIRGGNGGSRRAPSPPSRPQARCKLAASPKAFCFFSPGMAPSSTAWVSSDGSANPSDR